MENLFTGLSIILIIAAVISIIFKYFRQPPVMAYILTGIIVLQFSILSNENRNALSLLSSLGASLPLFILGLEFKILELKSIGKAAIVTAIGHTVIGTLIGFMICSLIGIPTPEGLLISFALTISSTIIVIKLLSDQKDLNSLHGKIAVGFVLIKDLIAILALVSLSAFSNGETPDFNTLMLSLIKLLFVLALTIAFSQLIFPRLMNKISNSNEILFVTSLAWAFGMGALVHSSIIGFPIEIGAFLAGLALANTTESAQIISKVKSLREFFLILFFVVLGTSLNLTNLHEALIPSIIVSIAILILAPVIVMIILGAMGYKSRTSFLTGISVAQVSEFSLLIVFYGKDFLHINDAIISIVTITTIITFSVSSFLIANGDRIHSLFSKYLKVFEKQGNTLSIYTATRDLENPIVLLGADRMGRSMLRSLKHMKDQILVLDFNPDITKELKEEGFNVIFGDIADESMLSKARIDQAKIIISTIPDFEDNLILLTYLKNELRNKETRPAVIVTAHLDSDKHELKELGADYVIMPYHSAGKFLGKLIETGKIEELL